ncbi:oxygen-independent coproporphyrinogen III oxidase [uncultured Aquimarina sp.]|uniref:oxygen-independent coproporphyrinogen III oxidase n=1 Tax=uncultured Aquimarina sp. TaxID=575652 RepID=UPI00261C7061|nr:oxygen-independent coproporphyrinogen III oxidase [uncultured Aquimarina sp.]
MCTSLITKYNVPGPRYTSYPTVPYWNNDMFSLKKWTESVQKSFHVTNNSKGISIYIHLPFCESLCTFCGCHKRITKRHEVEIPYINAVIKEWQLYVDLFGTRPIIKELHLGGGTPTFFSSENLQYLLQGIFSFAKKAEGFEFSFEGHPNNTTREQLQVLYDVGFRRVSFGVQDYDETVQKAIHRIQPFENVKYVTEVAREIGYTSISHDIVFGLPFQTEEAIIRTIKKTKELLPDRLAFYSYAHVPWQKGNGQRGFKESDLPTAAQKRRQYEIGKELLTNQGYIEIGMDHFALKSDALYTSKMEGDMHRNFMGYTISNTKLMIGLGASSISDSWYGFAQNVKGVEAYQNLVHEGIIPIYRGHMLTKEDEIIRRHILNLMCHFETDWSIDNLHFDELADVSDRLEEMESDGLVEVTNHNIRITKKGQPFVRNICMAFDLRLQRNRPETQLFSMTI